MTQLSATLLPEILVITPRRLGDARGWFCETGNQQTLADHNLPDFVQDNLSYSEKSSTIRGLHYQRPPFAQAKVVRCSRGVILDVAIDIRAGSAPYSHWVTVTLSADNGAQLFMPDGFLHGFMPLTPGCEVQCNCSSVYAPECDCAVRWDSVGIDWGGDQPALSDKDAVAPDFSDFTTPFSYCV